MTVTTDLVQPDGPAPPELLDHWQWRSEWHCDRPCLYWYLALDPADLGGALDDVLAPLHEADWLDVVPPPWWHVTLCDVGFGDEVGTGTATAVADEVAAELAALPPLDLVAGRVVTFPSAVALEVAPLDTLRRVQHAVRATTQWVVGPHRPLVHRHTFRPHLSLAYVNRPVGRQEAAATLSALRESPTAPPPVTVDRLSLVAATRRGRHYQWTVEHEVGLGGRRRGAVG